MTLVRLEPAASRSRVKHSTTDPLPSEKSLKVWANNADPDEMAHMSHLILTYTVCLLYLLYFSKTSIFAGFFQDLYNTPFHHMDSSTI